MGRESRKWIRRVGCYVVIVAVGLAGQLASAAGTERSRRIAIIPLENLRPNTDTDWIGVGAAETLTTKLGELPDLITVERTRVNKIIEERRLRAALSEVATAVKVGKLVGAERLLIGSYAKMGANIQFNVRVVDVATGVVLNRASVVRPEAKIFDALYALAEAVIESFKKKGVVIDNRPMAVEAPAQERLRLTDKQVKKLKKAAAANTEAFKAFGKGSDALIKGMTTGGSVAEAIRWLTKAIALDGAYGAAYCERGNAHQVQGDHDQAIRDYGKAIELNPTQFFLYLNRSNSYRGKGDYERAIPDLDKAIELRPNDAGIYNLRGTVHYLRRDYDAAMRDFSRAVELAPNVAEGYTNRGAVHEARGDVARAVQDYSAAIEVQPNSAATAYGARAVVHCKRRDYPRAVEDFTRAIGLAPRTAAHYSNRGNIYRIQRDYGRAVRDFDKAVELDPKCTAAYYNRGLAYSARRDHDLAIRDYTTAIRLNPNHHQAYANRGIAYRQKGDCGRAIRDYDRAISLNARFAPTYYNRALAHYFIRDYTKAWADVRACQRLGGKVHPRFLADLRKASGRHR